MLQSTLVGSAMVFGFASAFGSSPDTRTFELTYTAEIQGLPKTGRVDVWLPYPQSDEHQDINEAEVSSPYPPAVTTESEYGNSILHVSAIDPKHRSFAVTMRFKVTRREHLRRDLASGPVASDASGDAQLTRWRQRDRLVPIDGRITALAREVTEGKRTDLERARAIYDYVLSTMKYDKSGTGWGNGDIYWACDYKRGNCTDFHALFIGLCRAVGIPAKFEIGFPLPADAHRGEIRGYHCWAQFYLRGIGWVPVDTSEASLEPARREYFFGANDAHRVRFTAGRDILLEPRQAGPALNYFINPYVEVNGQPFGGVKSRIRFQDIEAGAAMVHGW